MTYNTIVTIATSETLLNRVAAAAAAEGEPGPHDWAYTHQWVLAAQPGWDTAWESAQSTMTVNDNPDLGERDDVITDGMILASVQSIIAEENPS